MKNSKVSRFISSQDAATRNTQSEDMDVVIISPKMTKPNRKEKKELGILADISHKNTSGANNWQTFLKMNQRKTKGLSKPNLNKTNRPNPNHTYELSSTNLITEQKGKRGRSHFNISSRTNSDDKPALFDESQSLLKMKSGERQTEINRPQPILTKQIAMDCEMVGVEVGVKNNMLARVSLVDANGDCIYDKYVKPTEPVLDYRTGVSGIRPKDLENATDFKTVQQEVADIITGRILVGHALHNDLRVLFLGHPRHARRDTSTYKRFRVGPIPSLKSLAKKYLGVAIQEGEHSSKQDALAAMQLYKMFKKEWEASFYKKKLTNQKTKTKSPSANQLLN